MSPTDIMKKESLENLQDTIIELKILLAEFDSHLAKRSKYNHRVIVSDRERSSLLEQYDSSKNIQKLFSLALKKYEAKFNKESAMLSNVDVECLKLEREIIAVEKKIQINKTFIESDAPSKFQGFGLSFELIPQREIIQQTLILMEESKSLKKKLAELKSSPSITSEEEPLTNLKNKR